MEHFKSSFALLLLSCSALILCTVNQTFAQDPDDYFLGHGFAGTGDTVFTNSGTFWDDGYDTNYSTTADWEVVFCTTAGNPNPLTLEFKGFATHYGGGFPPGEGEFYAWDYMRIRYAPAADYYAYHDDTPEFSFTSQDGCIRFNLVTNGDGLAHDGWEAEIYAIPPPPNNDPCGASLLTVGNVCTPQVFTNKGAYYTDTYPSPCHNYFGGDVWFTAVVPASGNLKIESFPGTLDWAVMNLYTGSSCTGLSHYACIEDSVGMPTAYLSGFTPGDTIYIRMFGDQAKSGTFGMCASDPTVQIVGHTGPAGVGDDSTNVLWLRADQGVLNNGDTRAANGESVKTWKDQSGNGNHVLQATPANQPLLADNSMEDMPAIHLDGSEDYLATGLSSLSAPLTFFTVARFTAGGTDAYLMSMGDEVSTAKTVSISRENDDRYYTYTDDDKWYGPALDDDTVYLLHAVHNIGSTFHELYVNETDRSPADYSSSVLTNGSLRLGTSRNTTDFFGGDLAEFIIYKQKLNQAQKIIVENSLAAKYGISIPTDKYSYRPEHKYDVAGIGQVDINNRHTEAQSAATLSIGNPTDLDDGEFLLFGHDNGDISTWTAAERPNNDPNIQRIAREWRVDISGGDPGLLTLTLNDSLLPDLVAGFSSYTLWTDSDGDFSSGAEAIPLIRVDGEFVANTVTLSDGCYLTVTAVMPVVGFTADSSSGPESLTYPSVGVSLNYAVNEEVSVVFRSIDGSAAGGGADYLLNPGSATFAAGTTLSYIQPQILDDTLVEGDEDFYLRLSDPDPGIILSADSNHTYTILNDDIQVLAGTDRDTIGECGTVSAQLSVAVSGTGPFVYAWTPSSGLSADNIADPMATPATSTWYRITVTDQTNGAVGVDSIRIVVAARPAKPTITAGGSTSFCEGDSVLLTASTGNAWLWSGGDTIQAIYANQNGSYTVKVFDIFGCGSDDADSVSVLVYPIPPAPVISPSGETGLCPGDSVDLVSSDADMYLWTTAETSKTIRVKTAGEYALVVRSADGCWSDTSLTQVVSLKTPPGTPTIMASGPTDFCPGDSVDLNSPTGDTWLWSSGDTTQVIRVKTAGSFTVQITDSTGCLSDPSTAVNTAFLPEPPVPAITPGGSTDICENDSVSLSAPDAAAWFWSTGDSTRDIYAKLAGDYTVKVGNAEGCWSPGSAPLTVSTQPAPDQPSISFSGDPEFCEGDSLVLVSSAGISYLWSGGDTTDSITVKTSGSYSVRVANAAGCLSLPSEPVNTTSYPLPGKPLISGDTLYCAGDSVLLTGPPAAAYQWSTGDSTVSIYAAEGIYSLAITDEHGCESPLSDPRSITEHPLPSKPLISGNGSYCEGDSTLLGTGPASAYQWSTGENTRNITVKAGTYTVVVFDSLACGSPPSDPFPVTELPKPDKPVITPDGPTDFWAGDSLVLSTGSAETYLWYPGGETSPEIVVKAAGEYSLVVGDANGCLSDLSESVTITVLTYTKPVVSVEGDTEFCEGEPPALLSAPDAFAWEWSTGEDTQSISAGESGEYRVRLFSETGYGSEWSDPVRLTLYPAPSASLAGMVDVKCFGEYTGSAEVSVSSGTGPYNYTWTDGQTGALAAGLKAGIHQVVVEDANHCLDTMTVEIMEPDEIRIQPEITNPYCSDALDGSIRIQISGGIPPYFSLWSDGTIGESLEDLGPGSLEVEVTDGNQCQATGSYTLYPANNECIRVGEIITPNNDGYNDTWRIPGIEYYPEATVEVYDRWGKQVFFARAYDQTWDGTYDGKELPMASYHYIVKLNNSRPAIVGNLTIIR